MPSRASGWCADDLSPAAGRWRAGPDLRASPGLAILATDGRITSGRAALPAVPADRIGLRFQWFRRWLTEAKNAAGELQAVAFDEQTGSQALADAHGYGGMVATLTAWAEHHRIAYAAIPEAIGAANLGCGDTSGASLIQALRRIGHAPGSIDEARALALLLWQVTR